MAEKRPLYLKRIIAAFIIATLIFIGGFLTSYIVSYSKYQSISISQEKLRYNLLNLDLEQKLMIDSCELFDIYLLSDELSRMGNIIGILEGRFGKLDSKVIEKKKIYTFLEVQHLLFIEEYNKKCNKSITTILFFYSNQEEFADDAEKIGYILSSLKTQEKEVMIYSFDYDLVGSNLINLLKKKYNLTNPNIIIINGVNKIENLQNIEEIKAIL